MVVIVSSRESAMWRNASVKTVLRKNQLKYVDVDGMRVVTNRCVAEQIKNDKAKNVVMDGSEVGEFGKVGREQILKSIVMNGVKVGKLENQRIDEEMRSQSEERLCKSIIKGLARRHREKHAMLAEVEQDVIRFDDITGKELPWHAVRKARELELKYLRDLGVYEKNDENEAVAQYKITPVDTKWVDTDKAFEEEPMQIRSRIVAREFKSDDQPGLYAGTPPLEALKAIISIAANHKETFSIMHFDVSCAKAKRPVLIRLPVEDSMGADAGKIGLFFKKHVWHKGRSQQLGA